MKIVEETTSPIVIKCPYCGRQSAPPEYPYCEHTVFLYLDPTAAEPAFDYVMPSFAEKYLPRLLASGLAFEEDEEEQDFSDETKQQFLTNKLPFADEQEIRLYMELLTDDLFSGESVIYDITEDGGPYPTRVVVAYQR